MTKKILITGGTGRLGSVCSAVFPNALYPGSKEMDIRDSVAVDSYFSKYRPESVIHLAALASIPGCETNKQLAWDINVKGTKNLLQAAKKYNVKRFLYLQTACIFSGENAPYDEDSIPDPKHYYGFTKAIAEQVVVAYDSETLSTKVARTNFTTMPWEYKKAFTDRFGTYLFAKQVAQGLKEFLEDNSNISVIHLCGDTKISMYEYATLGGSEVGKITIDEYNGVGLTRDMSLITKNWHTYKISPL